MGLGLSLLLAAIVFGLVAIKGQLERIADALEERNEREDESE